MCEPSTGICKNLYWDMGSRLIYDEKQRPVGYAVSCFEAKALFSPNSYQIRAAGDPEWFKLTDSMETNLRRGLTSIREIMNSVLLPSVHRLWPFSEATTEAAGRVMKYIKLLKTFVNFQNGGVWDALNEFCEDPGWKLWKLFIQDMTLDLYIARFDQSSIEKGFNPLLKMHIEVFIFLKRYVSLDSHRLSPYMLQLDGELDSAYTPWIGAVESVRLLSAIEEVERSVSEHWADLETRRLEPPGIDEMIEEDEKLVFLEQQVYRLVMRDPEGTRDFQALMCPSIVEFTAYVSWLWFEDRRRAHQLLFSVFELCKSLTDIKTRRAAIDYLPTVFRHPTYFTHLRLSFSSSREDVIVRESLPHLQDESLVWFVDIIIRFRDSDAEGKGTRAHWLQTLFGYFFKPGNEIFEYSDETYQFLKPLPQPDQADLFAVGRVIGLSVRFGLTVGARLSPCGIALLRLVLDAFEFEKCVEIEDPHFIRNLNGIGEAIQSMDDETAAQYIESVVGEAVPKSKFADFKREQIYAIKIAPIRSSYILIKRGIDSVLPKGALSVFTQDELHTMINGEPALSAASLWRGIQMNAEGDMPLWLEDIISQETGEFRFAFHQFATGVVHPPVGRTEPWISVRIDERLPPDALPEAFTCFGSVRMPQYPSREILKKKLYIAVYEGNASIDLH